MKSEPSYGFGRFPGEPGEATSGPVAGEDEKAAAAATGAEGIADEKE